MKKSLAILMIVAIIGVCCFTLAACNQNTDKPELKPGDFIVGEGEWAAPAIDVPSDLPDYMLKIKWLDAFGVESDNAFIRNRPTVIVFHGAEQESNTKFTLNLNPDVYVTGSNGILNTALSSYALSYYWVSQNFNIGVFHYENFADDTLSEVNAKIYNKSHMTYRDTQGQGVNTGTDFNLTEAFVAEWLKLNADDLDGTSVMRMMEVRFVGVNVGANLALSAAEYLEELYNKKLIGAQYLPNRVDILNPYFSNDGDATVVDFKYQTTTGSALNYNAKVIEKLAGYGVIMDMVESDATFYSSYTQNYTGIEEQTGQVIWSEEGDSGTYLSIKKNVAYLNFNESFSSSYPRTYVKEHFEGDLAVLHWFLYSVSGSDTSEISNQTGTNQKAMLDGLKYMGTSSTYSAVKYGVSAWTPTIYLRAVRGVEYEMKTYNSSTTATTKFSKFTMSKFRSEAYQISDLTPDTMYTVCGYVYETDDEHDSFVNIRRDKVLGGVTIDISATKSDQPTYKATVTTASDGFYSYNVGKIRRNEEGAFKEVLGYTAAIKVQMPSNRYTVHSVGKPNELTSMTTTVVNVYCNAVTAESGASITMQNDESTNFFVGFLNAALYKKF